MAQGPERATARILGLCRTSHTQTLAEQLDDEARFMAANMVEPESAEGIFAVLEKRSPNFVALRAGKH